MIPRRGEVWMVDLGLAAKVRPAQTWFTHLCHDLRHAEIEAELPAGVRVAFDGLRIET